MDIDLSEFLNPLNLTSEDGANISLKLEDITNDLSFSYSLKTSTGHYAASLIKLFHAYMAYKKLKESKPLNKSELLRAIEESLKVSDNDALGYLMDFNSKTQSGLELDGSEWLEFKNSRAKITSYFKELSYSDSLNLANKCFSFSPYGRDFQLAFAEDGLGRNFLDIEDVSKIMHAIRQECPELLSYMRRDITDHEDEQLYFISKGLEPFINDISEIYSKAGWTSAVRHDTAFIYFKDGSKYLLTVMTTGLSSHKELISELSSFIFKQLSQIKLSK